MPTNIRTHLARVSAAALVAVAPLAISGGAAHADPAYPTRVASFDVPSWFNEVAITEKLKNPSAVAGLADGPATPFMEVLVCTGTDPAHKLGFSQVGYMNFDRATMTLSHPQIDVPENQVHCTINVFNDLDPGPIGGVHWTETQNRLYATYDWQWDFS